MDTELKCNRLTCRTGLSDKAVVTTCSHIFCIDCANELFTSARLCPACETSLTEPDDVVVCSLQPTNDYKTSVLSGLSPSVILEICSRAISFWQYQIHQENSFQQAIVRSINDKNAQLQKQLENVVREANSEINLLSNKIAQLERDLENDKKKVRDLQEAARERDKEYQKLKVQHDKLKRKTLLGPAPGSSERQPHHPLLEGPQETHHRIRHGSVMMTGTANLEAVVGDMEASGIQRTPLVPKGQNIHSHHTQHMSASHQAPGVDWRKQKQNGRHHRQRFAAPNNTPSYGTPATVDRSFHSVSDHSDIEVEHILLGGPTPRMSSGWGPNAGRSRPVFAPPVNTKRTSIGFRPAGLQN